MSNQDSCDVPKINKAQDHHMSNSFKEALNLMSSSKKDFMVFPMDPSLFSFDIKIDLSSYDSISIEDVDVDAEVEEQNPSYSNEFSSILIEDINTADADLNQYLKNIGNNNELSSVLSSKLHDNLYSIKSEVGEEYNLIFKGLATNNKTFSDWHKDRNNCEDYNHVEYNIVIALTRPGTWFCDGEEQDRFIYDKGMFKDSEYNKLCESDLLYEVPEFSGVIFRACDDYSAVHANPPSEQRLILMIELSPIDTM